MTPEPIDCIMVGAAFVVLPKIYRSNPGRRSCDLDPTLEERGNLDPWITMTHGPTDNTCIWITKHPIQLDL